MCLYIYIEFYLYLIAYNGIKINKRLYLSAGLAERGYNITCLVIQKTHTSKRVPKTKVAVKIYLQHVTLSQITSRTILQSLPMILNVKLSNRK